MSSRRTALGIAAVVALGAAGCGGGSSPIAPAPVERAAGAGAADSDEASASATTGVLTKQRWIVRDACADGRGVRVRLHDFTDRGGQFPLHGYWRLANMATLNRVIECRRGHQICMGAVQEPPPGLEWGVGIRGERYPCRAPGKCCFRCDTFAHSLKLTCEARTQNGLAGLEGDVIEDEAPDLP